MSSVFRLHGYRGEHRQYYYLVPITLRDGTPVPERLRFNTRDANEWTDLRGEPDQDRWHHPEISVFMGCVPPHERVSKTGPNQAWKERFAEANYGCCFHLWGCDGERVVVTEAGARGRGGGFLSQVERVPLSELPQELRDETTLMVTSA